MFYFCLFEDHNKLPNVWKENSHHCWVIGRNHCIMMSSKHRKTALAKIKGAEKKTYTNTHWRTLFSRLISPHIIAIKITSMELSFSWPSFTTVVFLSVIAGHCNILSCASFISYNPMCLHYCPGGVHTKPVIQFRHNLIWLKGSIM